MNFDFALVLVNQAERKYRFYWWVLRGVCVCRTDSF